MMLRVFIVICAVALRCGILHLSDYHPTAGYLLCTGLELRAIFYAPVGEPGTNRVWPRGQGVCRPIFNDSSKTGKAISPARIF